MSGILETFEQDINKLQEDETVKETTEEITEELEEDGIQEQEQEQEEAAEEEIAEEEDEPKDGKSYQKLRKRSQEAEAAAETLRAENAQIREALAQVTGKVDALLGTGKQPETTQEAIPEYDELDPKEYIDYHSKLAASKLEEANKKIELAEQDRALAESKSLWDSMDKDYRAKDKAYDGAMEYLFSMAKDEMKTANPTATDYQINQEIKKLEYQHVGNASNSGLSPDAYFKTLALQAGYDQSVAKKVENAKVGNAKKNQRKGANLIGKGSQGTNNTPDASTLGAMNMDQLMSITASERNEIENSY